jgi:hypothetical protein
MTRRGTEWLPLIASVMRMVSSGPFSFVPMRISQEKENHLTIPTMRMMITALETATTTTYFTTSQPRTPSHILFTQTTTFQHCDQLVDTECHDPYQWMSYCGVGG